MSLKAGIDSFKELIDYATPRASATVTNQVAATMQQASATNIAAHGPVKPSFLRGDIAALRKVAMYDYIDHSVIERM